VGWFGETASGRRVMWIAIIVVLIVIVAFLRHKKRRKRGPSPVSNFTARNEHHE
jgi:hypothetical protein